MGGTARGAARSGAPHAMVVNETIIAITRTTPELTRPVRRARLESVDALPPAQTTGAATVAGMAGIGTVASWSTEVVHHLPAGGRNRLAVQADAVLLAPEAGVLVLVVEVDNCTETSDVLAAKFDRYRRFFRVKTKGHQGLEVPVWSTLYGPTGREGHPPVAVVFNPGIRTGEQALKNRMNSAPPLLVSGARTLYLTARSRNPRVLERITQLLTSAPPPTRPTTPTTTPADNPAHNRPCPRHG
jgi:hypothetical protein